jgi:hypothetical protein
MGCIYQKESRKFCNEKLGKLSDQPRTFAGSRFNQSEIFGVAEKLSATVPELRNTVVKRGIRNGTWRRPFIGHDLRLQHQSFIYITA